MPTPSESRVKVSGKLSKAVLLLRKRLRLSLRAMMIVVLGIGGVLGWVAHRVTSARRRRCDHDAPPEHAGQSLHTANS